jgi:23S rRNA (uridine2552-2'-O)-methyltransferase
MPRFVVKASFYNKAKKEGYRARSAYKLEEIQQRFKIISKGDKILDLGAAPGSWLQMESSLTGEKGIVMGVDILPIKPLPQKNIVIKQADIREMTAAELLAEAGAEAFDVVTSDIAPNLSGIKDVDNANVLELCQAVFRVVRETLKKGGNFLIKLFFNPELRNIETDLKPLFSRVTIFKPKSSRGVSSEVYLVCTGKR